MIEKYKQNGAAPSKIERLCVTALMLALSTVLGYIKIKTGLQGGSITLFSMVPIVLIAWRYGFAWGTLTGMLRGLLDLLIDPTPLIGAGLSWFTFTGSFIFDYLLPFGSIGFVGIFATIYHKRQSKSLTLNPTVLIRYITIGAGVSMLMGFCFHVISGMIFWSDLLQTGFWGSLLFSVSYNALYMAPELILTVIGTAATATVLLRSKWLT